jgi:hypothetical protein
VNSAWEWISLVLSPASPFKASTTFSSTFAILSFAPRGFLQGLSGKTRICCHEKSTLPTRSRRPRAGRTVDYARCQSILDLSAYVGAIGDTRLVRMWLRRRGSGSEAIFFWLSKQMEKGLGELGRETPNSPTLRAFVVFPLKSEGKSSS